MLWKRNRPAADTTTPVVIVLGMHRSGTSCLAGSLESAGLYLGDVNTAAQFNKKGNRENSSVTLLNDRILANSGHSWMNPPPGAATWTRSDKRARDKIVAALSKQAPWGFKDPRTLLTLEGWLEALPLVRFVGTFRHPMRVAKSLAARPDPIRVAIPDGLNLWYAYNQRLLDVMDRFDVPLLNFDEPPDVYQARVDALSRDLELTPSSQAAFFDQSLRTSKADDDEVAIDDKILALYETLKKIAAS